MPIRREYQAGELMSDNVTIPKNVAVCPYCGDGLTAEITGEYEEDDGTRVIDEIMMECDSEPDLDSRDWHEWLAVHSDMPYVNWLPVEMKVQRWLNRQRQIQAEASKL